MHSAVISDASCLIVLEKIGSLELLQQTYGQILTTPEIAGEIRFALPPWIIVRNSAKPYSSLNLPLSLDPGEASAIALALEIPDSILIVDERAANNYAKKLGLNVTGTLGVIVKAKLNGVIPTVKPIVEALRKTNFRFSATIEREIYIKANEEPY